MVLNTDRERLKTLLIETITLLCKNGLDFQNEFSVDALIGITLDQSDVFLVTIKETVKCSYDNDRSGESGSSHKEKEGERLSDVSLHSQFSHADFLANTPQVISDCQINCERLAVTSIENDTRVKFLSAAMSHQKQTANPGRKNFSGAFSLPKDGDRLLPNASASSPSVDDNDVDDLEDVIPIVSLQKDIDAPDEEPPRKRQHGVEPMPRKRVHSNTNSQEELIQDIITQCKSEPLDVIKLENSPVDESGCSVRQDNSNFLYSAMCNNEGNARFDPAYMNLYGQENLLGSSAVPGCSSWPMNATPVSSKSLQDQVGISDLWQYPILIIAHLENTFCHMS